MTYGKKRAWTGSDWKRKAKNRKFSKGPSRRSDDRDDSKRQKRDDEDRDRELNDDEAAAEVKSEAGDDSQPKKQTTRQPRPLAEGEEREERRPKKKVAVLIGYCGTGYKGMQLNPPTKTIEGDLFAAFVEAKAISKDNSDDPKKSSLVRCARTDKGVHAAGNVISLKLIIEDPDIKEKINAVLTPQIRIWDIIPTTGGFSCYQLCDSRVYEYLVPTYTFLPPHPQTYFGKRLREAAEEEGDLKGWESRLEDTADFWETTIPAVTEEMVAMGYERKTVEEELLYTLTHDDSAEAEEDKVDIEDPVELQDADANGKVVEDPELQDQKMADAPATANDSGADTANDTVKRDSNKAEDKEAKQPEEKSDSTTETKPKKPARWSIKHLRKQIKAAFLRKKRAYRIPETRLQRVRDGFRCYEGNFNFHNFTIQKSFKDASARRLIKTFTVSDPMIIHNTEWLSLKVHGQSFMMHQIRKMVGMVMLTIRSGCPLERITQAYGPAILPIPKAPSVGLLLQNPVFDNYNKKASQFQRKPVDFEKHKEAMEAFKKEWIYDKLFLEEEKTSMFNAFLSFLDNFSGRDFDYLTSKGLKAAEDFQKAQALKIEKDKQKQNSNEANKEDDEPTARHDSSDEEEGDEEHNG